MIDLTARTSFCALLIVTLAASACGGDDPATSGPGGGNGTTDPVSEEIVAAEGGTVADADGAVSLTIPPGSLSEDTEITLTISAKHPDTVTNVFEFAPADVTLSTAAALSISTTGVSVPDGEKAVVAVAADGGWGELPGSVESAGALQAQTSTLGTFAVILAEVPAGPCDASCMSQSGAVCCTTCGCEAEIYCAPTCAGATKWDCEVGCCFDYELVECAP